MDCDIKLSFSTIYRIRIDQEKIFILSGIYISVAGLDAKGEPMAPGQ